MDSSTFVATGFALVVVLQVAVLVQNRHGKSRTDRRLDSHDARLTKLEQQATAERSVDAVALKALLADALAPIRAHMDERLDRQEQKVDEIAQALSDIQAGK